MCIFVLQIAGCASFLRFIASPLREVETQEEIIISLNDIRTVHLPLWANPDRISVQNYTGSNLKIIIHKKYVSASQNRSFKMTPKRLNDQIFAVYRKQNEHLYLGVCGEFFHRPEVSCFASLTIFSPDNKKIVYIYDEDLRFGNEKSSKEALSALNFAKVSQDRRP